MKRTRNLGLSFSPLLLTGIFSHQGCVWLEANSLCLGSSFNCPEEHSTWNAFAGVPSNQPQVVHTTGGWDVVPTSPMCSAHDTLCLGTWESCIPRILSCSQPLFSCWWRHIRIQVRMTYDSKTRWLGENKMNLLIEKVIWTCVFMSLPTRLYIHNVCVLWCSG